MRRFFLHILFSLVFFAKPVSGYSQKFYAQVNNKNPQVGQVFELSFVITVQASDFTPPNLRDFEIAGGPNQSTSIQYINGQMSQSVILSYLLVPRKEGKFTIGSASINSNGQKLETSPITIEVGKSQQSASQSSGNSSSVQGGGEDIFMRTILSKNKCYLGEQITITQKLYTRYQFLGFQKGNVPNYDGFWSQNLEPTGTIKQLPNEVVNGIQYYVYQLFHHQAAPSKSGKISIAPLEEEVVIRRANSAKPRNVWEQFFGTGYEDVAIKLKSNTATIEVMELPKEGRPSNFSGAVGAYSYKAEVNKTTLKANDAFNLKITISGKGNMKLIDAPSVDLPESFEKYDPKLQETANAKVFDYLVIPREEGEYELNNLGFSYFNLETKKYVVIPSPQIKIIVLPPDPSSTAGAQVYSPLNRVKETENDIRYIKRGKITLEKKETEFFNSSAHIGLLLSPVFLLLLALVGRRKYIKENSNIVLVKQRRAIKLAKKQLASAEKYMRENDKDKFYNEILLALNRYIADKLCIEPAYLSKENIADSLKNKQISDSDIAKVLTTLEQSEFAKYAPGSVSGNLTEVYESVVELIGRLEEQLNKNVA